MAAVREQTIDFGIAYDTPAVGTFGSATTSGNTIILAITHNIDSGEVLSVITDNKGNTYTLIDSIDITGYQRVLLYYAYNITGGSSHTITVAADGYYPDITCIAREYSGLTTTDPLDKKSTTTTGASSGHTSAATPTTTQANELVLGVLATIGNSAFTAGSGFGNVTSRNGGDIYQALGIEDKDVTSTGTQTATFTTDFVSGGLFIVATFKESTGPVAEIEQEGFAFGDDDSSESGHTLDTQDTNITEPNGTKTLRLLLDATDDPASKAFKLKYQKNGSGGYSDVPVGAGSSGFQDGLASFLATWSGVASAYSFNNENTNDGTDTDLPGSSSYSQAETSVFPNYGLDSYCAPPDGSDFDVYTTVDVCMMLYIPSNLATGTYGLFHNGGGTNAQIGWIKSTSDGATIELGISHNASGSNQDYDTVTITERGWICAGFQFEDNSGNMAIWVNGSEVTTVARTYDLLYGSGNPYVGRESGDDIPGWGAGSTIDGSGLLIANFVADNKDNDNSQPAGNGDTFYTDYFDTHDNEVSNEIYVSTSSNVATGGEATTARLTAPSGKTTGDFTAGERYDDQNQSNSIDIASNEYTELEWVITTQDLATDDYIEFRVYDGDTVLDTYTLTPKWTIGSAIVNVTVTPSAIVLASSIPSPSITGKSNTTPGTISLSSSSPSITAEGGATVTNSAFSLSSSTPAPSITTGSNFSPSIMEASFLVPTPAVMGGAEISCDVVSHVLTIPTPTIAIGASFSPDVEILSLSVQNPEITGGVNVSQGVEVLESSVLALISTTGGSNFAASVLDSGFSVPSPTITTGSQHTPDAVSGIFSTPSITVSGVVDIIAPLLNIESSTPAPSVGGGVTVPVDVVSSSFSIPIVLVSGGVEVAPGVLSFSAVLIAPDSVTGGSDHSPGAEILESSNPVPSILIGAETNISTISIISSVPILSIFGGSNINIDIMEAGFSVPSPTVSTGSNAILSNQSILSSVPSVSVTIGGSFSPDAEILASSIPSPTITTGSNIEPNALDLLAALPSPSVSTATVAEPNTISLISSVLSPVVSGGVIYSIIQENLVSSIPEPTTTGGAEIFPSVLEMSPDLFTPTVTGGSVSEPDVEVLSIEALAVEVMTGVLVELESQELTSSTPAPTIVAIINIDPDTLVLSSSVPVPTVSQTENANILLETLTITATVPNPFVFSPIYLATHKARERGIDIEAETRTIAIFCKARRIEYSIKERNIEIKAKEKVLSFLSE